MKRGTEIARRMPDGDTEKRKRVVIEESALRVWTSWVSLPWKGMWIHIAQVSSSHNDPLYVQYWRTSSRGLALHPCPE